MKHVINIMKVRWIVLGDASTDDKMSRSIHNISIKKEWLLILIYVGI